MSLILGSTEVGINIVGEILFVLSDFSKSEIYIARTAGTSRGPCPLVCLSL